MTSPHQVIELMMKEAGIANIDKIVEESYNLKEVGKKYYLDISGKIRETGMRREVLGAVASLIFFPSTAQKQLLIFLSEAEEATKDYLARQFGTTAYSITVLTLNALGMVDIENRSIRRKNRRDNLTNTRISIVKPNHKKIKKFWPDLFPEVQQKKKQSALPNVRQSLRSRQS